MQDLAVLHGEALARYGFPPPHPFAVDRLGAFWTELRRRGLEKRVRVEKPASCTDADLLHFHTRAHVERVKEASRDGSGFLDAGDTPAFPGCFEAASTAVGTTLAALDGILSERWKRAFNPIGGLHHARRGSAAGFCVFNDIGVAIERLRASGIRRLAYVDIDVHHGDGVFYEYESDPDLAIADVHEDGRFLYPGTGFAEETGKGRAKGTKLNIPLMPGAGEAEFRAAWEAMETHIEASSPEFILLQSGADGLKGDPLAHLELTPACHRLAAERLRVLADRHAGGRLLAMGGGGYDLGNIGRAWSEVVVALA